MARLCATRILSKERNATEQRPIEIQQQVELLREVFSKRPAAITDTRRGFEAVDTIKYNGEREDEGDEKKVPQFL